MSHQVKPVARNVDDDALPLSLSIVLKAVSSFKYLPWLEAELGKCHSALIVLSLFLARIPPLRIPSLEKSLTDLQVSSLTYARGKGPLGRSIILDIGHLYSTRSSYMHQMSPNIDYILKRNLQSCNKWMTKGSQFRETEAHNKSEVATHFVPSITTLANFVVVQIQIYQRFEPSQSPWNRSMRSHICQVPENVCLSAPWILSSIFLANCSWLEESFLSFYSDI